MNSSGSRHKQSQNNESSQLYNKKEESMFIQRSDFSNFDQDHDSPKNRGFLTEKTQNKYDLNKFCVECQKPNPEWVSVNNGVYLCI